MVYSTAAVRARSAAAERRHELESVVDVQHHPAGELATLARRNLLSFALAMPFQRAPLRSKSQIGGVGGAPVQTDIARMTLYGPRERSRAESRLVSPSY